MDKRLKIQAKVDYADNGTSVVTIDMSHLQAIEKFDITMKHVPYSFELGYYIKYLLIGTSYFERFDTAKERDDRENYINSLFGNGTVY